MIIIEKRVYEPGDTSDPIGLIKNKYLYDVFEAKSIGFIRWDSKKPSEKPLCMVDVPAGNGDFQGCDSPATFENLIKVYIQ